MGEDHVHPDHKAGVAQAGAGGRNASFTDPPAQLFAASPSFVSQTYFCVLLPSTFQLGLGDLVNTLTHHRFKFPDRTSLFREVKTRSAVCGVGQDEALLQSKSI